MELVKRVPLSSALVSQVLNPLTPVICSMVLFQNPAAVSQRVEQ